jgi:hypothetical protein
MTVRPHGTRVRYVFGESGGDTRNGCRCFECSSAAVLYEKRRIAARRRGEVPYVDAQEAREHLLWLRRNGIGRRTIQTQTGLSNSTVQKIAKGTTARIRQSTADRILGLHLGKTPGGSVVDATRTLKQIDDLVNVVGMTRTAIALELGAKTRALQIGRNGRVTKENADKVDALWRDRMAPVLAHRQNEAERRAHYRAQQRKAAS